MLSMPSSARDVPSTDSAVKLSQLLKATQNSVLSGPPLISQREIFPEKLLLLFALSARMQYPLFEDHPSQRDVTVTFL